MGLHLVGGLVQNSGSRIMMLHGLQWAHAINEIGRDCEMQDVKGLGNGMMCQLFD